MCTVPYMKSMAPKDTGIYVLIDYPCIYIYVCVYICIYFLIIFKCSIWILGFAENDGDED
jgi:hypothetical protein